MPEPTSSLLAPQRHTPDFDRIARPYWLLEYLILGRSLSRTRTEHLAGLTACRRALILGDGDGRFLAALLRANPQLRATAIDGSRTMLQLLTERCAFAAARLRTHQADAVTFFTAATGEASFDLVTTHFFLDCFSESELSYLIPAIRARLLPGLRPTRLPDFPPLLRPAGRIPIRTRHRLGGLLLAQLWQLPPVGHPFPSDPR